MPAGVTAPARLVPPLALQRPVKNVFSSTGLSLDLTSGMEGGLKFSQSADSGMKSKDDDHESKSGSDNLEGASGDDQDPDQPPRKKRYHRHTPRQIQEMEMVFKECPHPDDKQRQQLSKDLGLSARQVKFWFQNRRTQMKAQQERAENSLLRAENEKLRAENITLRETLKNASCPSCGGPVTLREMSFDEQQLRIENARLKDELDRVATLAAKYLGRPIAPLASQIPSSSLGLGIGSSFGLHSAANLVPGSSSLMDVVPAPLSDEEKAMVVELAMVAMEELLGISQSEKPLWVPDSHGSSTLNQEEYNRRFPGGIGPTPYNLKAEATRDMGLVMMNGIELVETLLDSEKWMDMFPCIVSRVLRPEVVSPGAPGNLNGALQLMYAELQVLSPLVPTREIYFLRYCKQHTDGIWAVVDVSVDTLRQNPSSSLKCRLRPSGFLIQDMPNGYSKVTVYQHVEYDERSVNHLYRNLVNSGMAFGATRWLATLQRQCERLASLLVTNISARELGVIPSPNGRRSMLKLAQRMTNNFCAGVSASTVHTWTTLSGSGEEDVRVMTRKSIDNPGEPHGIVLSAATSLWLPVPPARIFEFLRNEQHRSEWDILSNGNLVQEMAHIAKGENTGNSVSLLRVNALNSNQNNMLILQESCTDVSGSLVVYAPVDIPAMNLVMQGGDPAYVALLPSGFAILPDGPGRRLHPDSGNLDSPPTQGSLLTVAFQILVSNVPTAKLNLESVETVNSLISCTVQRIKTALRCDPVA